LKVSEIMSRNPAYCWLSHSALTAATVMQQRDIGILPVTMDAFTPKLVGVVTDRDLCLHVIAAGRDPAHIWISECLTEEPVCCTAEDDVHYALELMKQHQVRRLPVVDAKNEIVGMLSFSDLVRKNAIGAEEIVAVLRRTCEPSRMRKRTRERIVAAA
jgi:CBS domain-containing protein